ncbi:hypothetical protein JI750_06665 [Flavobacterium sp. GN10]|uniref:LPXTG cell wall anchor domain-containing protein n=1 Tax=Flavobacterium tagetis TaxID=2801336 RepID=A0ABS1KAN6_9FLAO|nr:hypothetical protein [Flavobacterium tagetis]MBL0736561.1 hypothetical protein [Flavobacterium tagetis]
MKNLKAPFLVIALFLNVLLVSAETSSHPPTPSASTARSMATTAEGEECPPLYPDCDDAFPINQNIMFLVIGGLALGLTVIYKNEIKKASI